MKIQKLFTVLVALVCLWFGFSSASAYALTWQTSISTAIPLAKAQGKMILLVGGNPDCERTKYMRDQVCELTNPNIRGLIQQYYVPFYAGTYGERSAYTIAGSIFPLICIIDPNDNYGTFKDRTTQINYTYNTWDLSGPQEFYKRLQRYAQTSASCSFAISPSSYTYNASSQTGKVNITASSSCGDWTAVSGASWITVATGSSGTGNGTVSFSVSANTTGSTRTGTMTIEGKTVTVRQNGITSCSYSISPTSASFEAEARHTAFGDLGNKGTVQVTTSSGCDWSATSNVSWITITAGNTGSGDGTVSYTVSDNATGNTRTGTLTIGGKTLTVTQNSLNTIVYFPHIVTSAPWQTEIAIVNTSDQAVTGSLKALDDEGQVIEEMDVTLPARGREPIDIAKEFAKHADIAYIIFEAKSDAVRGYTKLSWDGISRTAIPAAKGGTGQVEGVFATIEKNGVWTGIALVNTEADEASVILTAYDDNGNQVATRTLTIKALAKMSKLAEEIFSEDISSATYIAYSSDRYIAGVQLNSSADGKIIDGLPGL